MGETHHERQRKDRYASLLGASHRRVLTTMLMRLELAIWRLEERLTRETPPTLILTHFITQLSPGQRDELLRLITQIRQQIAQMASDYGLEAREDVLRQTIRGEFSLLWSDLEETRPQKLRNYGELHPRAHDLLGPQVQELIDLVLAIERAVQ